MVNKVLHARYLPVVIARSDSDEAIHVSAVGNMDCFASLAMTLFARCLNKQNGRDWVPAIALL